MTDVALSVMQPWAWAMTDIPSPDEKACENRTQITHRRGRIWLHASKRWDTEAHDTDEQLAWWMDCQGLLKDGEPVKTAVPTGVIVGMATITDCHRDGSPFCECGHWGQRFAYHWVLAHITRLPEPVPAKGMLGFWKVDPDTAARCYAQIPGFSLNGRWTCSWSKTTMPCGTCPSCRQTNEEMR